MSETDPKEFDPAPSECWPHKPYEKADIHEGATHVATKFDPESGRVLDEHWRYVDCGSEWTV